MTRLAFTASSKSVSLFKDGRMFSIPSTSSQFAELKALLATADHDLDAIDAIINKPKMINAKSDGRAQVIDGVVYYNSNPVRNSLADRLIELLQDGVDIQNWLTFMERCYANPNERSRECLFDFLDKWMAPITEDGHFLAFKRIRPNFKDIYSGTMDNSVGKTVQVDREKVDSNPSNTCSNGLHVAASSYLDNYATSHNNVTVVCKVDPADVCAVPADYDHSKMRVSKYVVLAVLDQEGIQEVNDTKAADTSHYLVEEQSLATSDENASKEITAFLKTDGTLITKARVEALLATMSQTKAALELGIARSTLRRQIEKMGIVLPQ